MAVMRESEQRIRLRFAQMQPNGPKITCHSTGKHKRKIDKAELTNSLRSIENAPSREKSNGRDSPKMKYTQIRGLRVESRYQQQTIKSHSPDRSSIKNKVQVSDDDEI